MDVQQQVRTYVVENFLLGEDSGFANDASLSAAGIVDSTGVMELVLFIEKAFDVKVADVDLVPENFDTIRNMALFVERKLTGQGADRP